MKKAKNLYLSTTVNEKNPMFVSILWIAVNFLNFKTTNKLIKNKNLQNNFINYFNQKQDYSFPVRLAPLTCPTAEILPKNSFNDKKDESPATTGWFILAKDPSNSKITAAIYITSSSVL